MSDAEDREEIRRLKTELALLRGEAEAQPTTILEGPAEVIALARPAAPKAPPEDKLLPGLAEAELALDDGFVVQRMIELLRKNPSFNSDEALSEPAEYEEARQLALGLLALRAGTAKLLWMRREVLDIFRRSGQILEREVRRGVEGK